MSIKTNQTTIHHFAIKVGDSSISVQYAPSKPGEVILKVPFNQALMDLDDFVDLTYDINQVREKIFRLQDDYIPF